MTFVGHLKCTFRWKGLVHNIDIESCVGLPDDLCGGVVESVLLLRKTTVSCLSWALAEIVENRASRTTMNDRIVMTRFPLADTIR